MDAATPQTDPKRGDSKWRFESLDARAGLAFAAWRKERSTSSVVEEWPCLFFSPPSFTPEPVASVALAMAAARGTFQPGLLIEGREAFFETPEAVAEFVRRAYVSSGGGDGADGGGGGDEPIPPEEPPDLPAVGGFEEAPEGNVEDEDRRPRFPSASQSIGVAAKRFEQLTSNTAFGHAQSCAWGEVHGEDGVDTLATGALQVMRELMRRAPQKGSNGLLRWHGDLKALGAYVAQMGLWSELLGGVRRGSFRRLMEALYQPGFDWLRDHHISYVEKALLLFSAGTMLDEFDTIPISPDHREFLFRHRWAIAAYDDRHVYGDDPIEFLRRMPLPVFAQDLVGDDLGERASLYHLLSVFIASPQAALSTRDSSAVLDLVIFASACVVSSYAQPSHRNLHQDWRLGPDRPTPMQRQAIQNVVNEAMEWLIEHLPGLAFSQGFERSIMAARNIRYR